MNRSVSELHVSTRPQRGIEEADRVEDRTSHENVRRGSESAILHVSVLWESADRLIHFAWCSMFWIASKDVYRSSQACNVGILLEIREAVHKPPRIGDTVGIRECKYLPN